MKSVQTLHIFSKKKKMMYHYISEYRIPAVLYTDMVYINYRNLIQVV
jgi:hypothetical protein